MGRRVFLGMSGGVDSSVSALLLQQAGYEVSGVNLCMIHKQYPALPEDGGPASNDTEDGGPASNDTEDARAAAALLGIPFYALDFSDLFRETVIQDFIAEYQAGRTPNPCVVCNRAIKFGALLEKAMDLGGDFLATGHYARVARCASTGRWLLKRGADRRKDQSYFLYTLTQEQLSRILFPLGELHKSEVRELAAAHGLANAAKRDSQDICFVPGGDYAAFVERITGQPSPSGAFMDAEGRVLGRHKGFIRYTRGQHKGLGLSTEEPLYVLDKDPATCAIRLGPDAALWTDTLTAEGMNWISIPSLTERMHVTAKTRYSQREAEAVAEPLEGGGLRLTFSQPQRAVTPGQAVVLYDGETVVGGGRIVK